MLIQTLHSLFVRDLNRLRNEISLYRSDENLWKTEGEISNSAGNLCLHLVGNLNTYIGKELGGTDYIRNRPLEFLQKNISRQEILQLVDNTMEVVTQTLDRLEEGSLDKEYPSIVFEEKTSISYMLVHLATHLSYHLGQINYHRRLLDR